LSVYIGLFCVYIQGFSECVYRAIFVCIYTALLSVYIGLFSVYIQGHFECIYRALLSVHIGLF